MRTICLFFCMAIMCHNVSILSHNNPIKAFVVVPVVDLVGKPLCLGRKKENPYMRYDNLPLQSNVGSPCCMRLHQLVFNDVVEILESTTHEVKVKISNAFYVTRNNIKYPQNIYWADKKNFITFNQLKKCGISTVCIPKSIHYKHRDFAKSNENIITLKLPFYDPTTEQTFSAGTRFVRTKKTASLTSLLDLNDKQVEVFVFDKSDYRCKKIRIPRIICQAYNAKNNQEKRKNFINLVKTWANLYGGFIPYVWGGCSFTNICKKDDIVAKVYQGVPVYVRPSYKHVLLAGLDCSGLVIRAAQTCGIAYFCKNTFTITQYLPKIHTIKELNNGDLLVYNGHVQIVSDIKNNKLIEARTNKYGCGKIQEMSLCDVFKGVTSYKQLFASKKERKGLKRMDLQGNPVQNIYDFDFFKLLSD